MADKPLFGLNGKFRLAYDQHQWIVQHRCGRSTWRAVAFIGNKKTTLWRTLREREIWLSDEAIARVDALPDHFFSFLREHDPVLAKRHPIYRAHAAEIRGHTARSRPFESSGTGEADVPLDDALIPTPADDDLETIPTTPDRATSEAA